MKIENNRGIYDSWNGNEREVSYWKYSKINVVVDIENEFRVWREQIIEKHYTIK
jgi:tryptophan 2,3-dioxygenase